MMHDHLRSGDRRWAPFPTQERFWHTFVIGELALGNLRRRKIILEALKHLPQATTAADQEVLRFIEEHRLAGLGIGYIDAHLVASTKLGPGSSLWTRDQRLMYVAERLGVAALLDR
jgi:hypothetical protein